MPNGGVATLTRPAPRERTEQRDLTARDLPVLRREHRFGLGEGPFGIEPFERIRRAFLPLRAHDPRRAFGLRSEEHTSELRSLMRISYAVFCLKKKTTNEQKITPHNHTESTLPHQTHHK